MPLKISSYIPLQENFPTTSRCIIGQYDSDSIVVYQAFNPSIAFTAVRNQRLGGGGFKYERMSWIKTGFL